MYIEHLQQFYQHTFYFLFLNSFCILLFSGLKDVPSTSDASFFFWSLFLSGFIFFVFFCVFLLSYRLVVHACIRIRSFPKAHQSFDASCFGFLFFRVLYFFVFFCVFLLSYQLVVHASLPIGSSRKAHQSFVLDTVSCLYAHSIPVLHPHPRVE